MKFDDSDSEFDDSGEDYEDKDDNGNGDSDDDDDDNDYVDDGGDELDDNDQDNDGENDEDIDDGDEDGDGDEDDGDGPDDDTFNFEEEGDDDYIVDTVGNKPMFPNPDDTPLEGDASHPGHLDMRVGVIEEVYKHPKQEDYLVELVSLGPYDESYVQASALAKRYKDYKLLKNRKVIVCCNVEPLEPRDVGSKTGALLLASRYHITTKGKALGEYCELLDPPDHSEPGDRVYVEGYKAEPYPYSAAEMYEWMVKDIKVDGTGQVLYKGLPLQVEGVKGVVTTESYFDCDVRLD